MITGGACARNRPLLAASRARPERELVPMEAPMEQAAHAPPPSGRYCDAPSTPPPPLVLPRCRATHAWIQTLGIQHARQQAGHEAAGRGRGHGQQKQSLGGRG
jgi:hypothetical protein